ncbi:hypothetical protein LEP1GSC170_2161 [Leptospira interrogans serovar Bataviae str. HAI135]|nr:hypothetical protein LEP1GSC170_2161 [Leptospira interrogans serovar Bataviae str. HAI135]
MISLIYFLISTAHSQNFSVKSEFAVVPTDFVSLQIFKHPFSDTVVL